MRRVSHNEARAAVYTRHAGDVMRDRGVLPDEVEAVLTAPEVSYGPDPRGRHVMQRGDLSVVVDARRDPLTVVTVLWRRPEAWTSEEMKHTRARVARRRLDPVGAPA